VKRAGSAVDLRPAPKARARRTRRSVSIAPPKAGRGTECARQELSMRGALRRPASAGVIRFEPLAILSWADSAQQRETRYGHVRRT
jgi:hypothetical protein